MTVNGPHLVHRLPGTRRYRAISAIASRLLNLPISSNLQKRAGAVWLLLLISALALHAGPIAEPPVRTLQSIREIRPIKKVDPSHPIPVHIRGVITYYDTVAPNLFVQDRTGGVWVDLRGLSSHPDPGDFVDIQGEVGIGFSPYIAKPVWKVLGKTPLPPPLHLDYDKAATGAFDSQWAEMEGVVRSFILQSEGSVLVIDVATPTGSFKVRLPDYHAPFPMQLVDAKVRFRGVCASDFNTREQLVAIHLLMPNFQQIQILQPAPDQPFSIPASPVNSIRRFSSDLKDPHRVKVVGVVTARFPQRGLFLMDSSGGVYVQTDQGTPAQPGDEVEAIGFPAEGTYSPVMKSGSIRLTKRHFSLSPAQINGKTALKGGYDAQLITLHAVVESTHQRQGDLVLGLETDDHIDFEATLRNPGASLSIPAGSTVLLTGICSVRPDENGNPAEFEMVLRTPADLQVLASPPWLNARRGVTMVGGLLLVTVTIIGWVMVLRRRVQEQTRIIHRKLQAEAALEKRYRRVFERNTAGLFIAETDGKLIDCNDACARMLGFVNRQDMLDRVEIAERIVSQFCQSPDPSESASNSSEHRFQRANGAWAWALSNARLVHNGNDQPIIEGMLVDITERKLADEQIQFLAYYDSLTGLPNRTLLQDRLSKAVANARRHKERVAVLFLDLDRFKNINDSLGHSRGDLLLQKVSRRLALCARDQDTVARLGGDEFIMVLGAVEHAADAAVVAERVCREISSDFEIQGQVLNVSCSVGISLFPEHGEDVETLIKNADAAMYSSKEAGRNTFRFFTAEMTAQVLDRLKMESHLRGALEKHQFHLVFQPEISLEDGSIACCETLLRWEHPELGMVPPDRFIPIAESAGMIVRIGEWVLRSACVQARRWHDEGLLTIPVAVNVSAMQFRQEGFCDSVRRVLEETGLAPQFLELELTESVLLAHEEITFRVLEDLRNLGVSLALDDFGTGYSSLSYLKQFPVNKLKIDRAFIGDIAVDSGDAAITAAIVNMAKTLNMKVTAEGVEDEMQLNLLRSLGCDLVQGYLISKPVKADVLRDRVIAHGLNYQLPQGQPSIEANWPWAQIRFQFPSASLSAQVEAPIEPGSTSGHRETGI